MLQFVRELDSSLVLMGVNRKGPTPSALLFWSIEKLEVLREIPLAVTLTSFLCLYPSENVVAVQRLHSEGRMLEMISLSAESECIGETMELPDRSS